MLGIDPLLYSAGFAEALMLFDISNLPLEGATLDSSVEVPSFPWDGGGVVRCGQFRLTGRFARCRHGWEWVGHFGGQVEAECTRCLAPVAKELDVQFRLLVVPKPTEGRGEPVFESLDEDDPEAVDLICLEGSTLDFKSVLIEQIDLALPYRVLCQEKCLGLCPHCGTDLNSGPCSCDKPADERWIGLAELKEKFDSMRGNKKPGRK